MTLAPATVTIPPNQVAHGLEGITVCETQLSDVQGDAGRLILRGKTVEDLANRESFELAVAHLFQGNMGDAQESPHDLLAQGRMLAWDTCAAIRPVARSLPVYEFMLAGLAALPAGPQTHPLVLAGSLPVFLTAGYRLKTGLETFAPDPAAATADDLLRMLTGETPVPSHVRGLNRYLTTVLDHGLNASTFAGRVIASTGAEAKAGLLGAMGALSGPLHGGAPGPVLDMLDAAESSGDITGWVKAELESGRRLMGFGHRVYRTRDPRADVLRTGLAALSSDTGRLMFAEALEKEALRELKHWKPDRPLDTNVEFYTAVLLEAIGIDRSLFTPLFAVGRAPGWCAHMAEQQENGRLIRPQSRYIGP